MITINQYIKLINNFFTGHAQIKTVLHSNEFNFNADSDIIYPVAHSEYRTQSTTSTNIATQFEIIIADIFDANITNAEVEIYNDCNQIAIDFIDWLSNQDGDYTIVENISINPFTNGNVDRLAGCVFTLTFNQWREANDCIIPTFDRINTTTTTTTSTTTTTTTLAVAYYNVSLLIDNYDGTQSYTNNGVTFSFPLSVPSGTEISITPTDSGYTFEPSSITKLITSDTTFHFIASAIEDNGSSISLSVYNPSYPATEHSNVLFTENTGVWTNPNGLSYIYDMGLSDTTIPSSTSFRLWSTAVGADGAMMGVDTRFSNVTDSDLQFGYKITNAGERQSVLMEIGGEETLLLINSNNLISGYYLSIYRDTNMDMTIQYSADEETWLDFDTVGTLGNSSAAFNIITLLKNYGAITNPKIKF